MDLAGINIEHITDIELRTELFNRMQAERLIHAACSAHVNPTLEQWLEWTDPDKCFFLVARDGETCEIMGCATFTPFRGLCCEFDFTAFRGCFDVAVDMAKLGFEWIFKHTVYESIIGFCPTKNRHAWALAKDCGFTVVGWLQGASYSARRDEYGDTTVVVLNKGD